MNWLVRFKNKTFWLTFIPTILLLGQAVLHAFGVEIEVDGLQENLLTIVNILFTLLALLGVAVDPTTEGVGDSETALTYTEPK